MRIILLSTITTSCCFIFATTTHCMDDLKDNIKKDLHDMKKETGEVIRAFSPTMGEWINGELAEIANNPYKDVIAKVRIDKSISDGELIFQKNRLPIVHATLEKIFNRKLNEAQVPKIAIIYSGGGYRAMLYALGVKRALEKMGLLDAVMYEVGLSGSTWAMIPAMITGLPMKHLKPYIQKCISQPFYAHTEEEKFFIEEMIEVKKRYKQHINFADFYGALLANRLLECIGNKKHTCHISHSAQRIEKGDSPYPIFTATAGGKNDIENPDFYTITPHEVTNLMQHTSIPTWSLGRTFKNGTSTNNAPEQTAGYIMGTCGSAFGASIHNIEDAITLTGPLGEKIKKIIKPIEGERIISCYGKVPNFMYKMKTVDQTLQKEKDTILVDPNLILVDAGLNDNLPHTPVSGIYPQRKADVQIFIDASAGQIGDEFKKTVAHAKKYSLPFPDIDCDGIHKKTCNIFCDENDPSKPTVIYMPRISDHQSLKAHGKDPQFKKHQILEDFDLDHETNNGFAATQHFQYTAEHSNLVMRQAEFNILANQVAIFKAIGDRLNRIS